MKQALIYILKIWLTSSLLQIGAIGFYLYQINHRSLDNFGASSWMSEIITTYLEHLELGFIILWIVLITIIKAVGNTGSRLLKKKLNIFLLAEGLTIIWLTLFQLSDKLYGSFLPGFLLWLICSFSLGFSIMIYRLDAQSITVPKAENPA